MSEEDIFEVLEEKHSRFIFAGILTFIFIQLGWIASTVAYIATPLILFGLYPIILIMLRGTWRIVLVIIIIAGLLVMFGVDLSDFSNSSEPYEEREDPRYDPGY